MRWRETLSTATDLALIGIGVTVAALPVVSAGAAVRTGSVAVAHFIEYGYAPSLRELGRTFVRALLPGLGATALVVAVAGLLVVDVVALRAGWVPGGPPALLATGLAAACLVAIAALAAVRLGREPATSWWSALRWAGHAATRTPGAAVAVIGVVAVAAALGLLLPLTIPLVVGYTLFALHAVAARMLPA